MIKCETKGGKINVILEGTAEDLVDEVMEIIRLYAQEKLQVTLTKFIETLYEIDKFAIETVKNGRIPKTDEEFTAMFDVFIGAQDEADMH